MIKQIQIVNFKALRFHTPLKLGKVNLLTGANGKGKSSFCQALLVLSQSWRQGMMRNLLPNGSWVHLGGYKDILYSHSTSNYICYNIVTGEKQEEEFYLEYNQSEANTMIGELSLAKVGGKPISDEAGSNEMSSNTDAGSETAVQLSTLNDYPSLMALKNMCYIASERRAAPYREPVLSFAEPSYLMPDGSNILNVLYQKTGAIQEVESLMVRLFKDAKISLIKTENDMVLTMNSVRNDGLYMPINVGFGYSYILSLLTALVIAPKGSTMIVENPEAHLHPSAQSELMNILMEYAWNNNIQLFVETHSDHVLNATLLAVKNPEARPTTEDTQVLFFSTSKNEMDYNEVIVRNLEISQQGHILNPPKSFFEQYALDLRALYRPN